MQKLKSRKLWAFVAWIVITVITIFASPDNATQSLTILGWVTGVYIGGQAAVDAIAKFKGE